MVPLSMGTLDTLCFHRGAVFTRLIQCDVGYRYPLSLKSALKAEPSWFRLFFHPKVASPSADGGM
jgi:hypothetical protein